MNASLCALLAYIGPHISRKTKRPCVYRYFQLTEAPHLIRLWITRFGGSAGEDESKMSRISMRTHAALPGIFGLVATLTATSPALSADVFSVLNTELSKAADGQRAFIQKATARNLYLENVKIRSHGVDFFNGCQQAKIDKHAQLPDTSLPVIQYKGIPIVGSPYHSVPIKTGKNNNEIYFKRLTGALKIIENHAPKTFQDIANTIRDKRGYMIVDNVCPSPSGLAFAAFIPRTSQNNFVVMVSSTLLLLPDLFNEYDIASQLIHEMHGHAVDYYRRGTTDETHAFTAQAAFADKVGDQNFIDVNNRAANIRTKVKLKLSTTGTYVKNK